MRKLLLLVPLLLAGCGDSVPCMRPFEKGEVIRSETAFTDCTGNRGPCSSRPFTYLNIKVNGVSRTCVVDNSVAKMFKPGEVIHLQTGNRL